VSVRASTWYVLRVTARNAAGSADCFLKFQTAHDDSSPGPPLTLLPPRLIVETRPFYARLDVMLVSSCGVLVTVVLVTVAVVICCRWRRRQRPDRRHAGKVPQQQSSLYYSQTRGLEFFSRGVQNIPRTLAQPSHQLCLSQARINWEGCVRKGNLRKNGGDDRGGGTN